MLNVKRELTVQQSQSQVWDFVGDMGNWARQMPGYVSHEVVDENDSVWTVQFNMGPFTRPCIIDVHVLRWAEPSEIEFSIKGRHDPFQGHGVFNSEAAADDGTHVKVDFGMEITGSMAKVISVMAAPVLTKLADQMVVRMGQSLGGPAPAQAASGEPSSKEAATVADAQPAGERRPLSKLKKIFR